MNSRQFTLEFDSSAHGSVGEYGEITYLTKGECDSHSGRSEQKTGEV
ncbi:hypothetical protein FOPG_16961 [Fusarium oxysporum f. sp. conglutinans race 2 54008]|uniref:Uncharacterized protein n=2 Tax=Fusarium oxysporum TaxID=5507 RepID=X0KFY6_FUSOX|nr:hypothetical protein FOPG_16961 [Fusarium oxysporum f. sp. conglutinans race 2 54008]EXM12514.1 hypothetical protein FOTG_18983 [Fusarium oxysporum f. sp. vasinfectum 25433]